MTPEERLTEAVRTLSEHFDVVQVFCQLHSDENDSTDVFCDGRGNTLARKHQIEAWLGDWHKIDPGEELTT